MISIQVKPFHRQITTATLNSLVVHTARQKPATAEIAARRCTVKLVQLSLHKLQSSKIHKRVFANQGIEIKVAWGVLIVAHGASIVRQQGTRPPGEGTPPEHPPRSLQTCAPHSIRMTG